MQEDGVVIWLRTYMPIASGCCSRTRARAI